MMATLGMSPDPAVLDVLFGAPVPPLLRLALALRAGRSLSGGRGEPITRYLAGHPEGAGDPLSDEFDPQRLLARSDAGELQWVLDRLSTSIRDEAEAWCEQAVRLARDDGGGDLRLYHELVNLASHLVQLPSHSILPPLGAAEDSVAVGLKAALRADGDGDANQQLRQVFRFLGGRYVDHHDHPFDVCDAEAPDDPIGRWEWFCGEVRRGRKRADELWTWIIDPPS
jgi:hypothetical protein